MLQAICKLLMFAHLYLLSCNYFWMLCEGIYLHTLIVVAVFAEKQHLLWYYLLGWGEWSSLSTENQANMLKQWCHSVLGLDSAGFPLIPTVLHSVARHGYYNDKWELTLFSNLCQSTSWNVLLSFCEINWSAFVYCVVRWGDVLTDVGSALTRRCSTSSMDPSVLHWWWDENTRVQFCSPDVLLKSVFAEVWKLFRTRKCDQNQETRSCQME